MRHLCLPLVLWAAAASVAAGALASKSGYTTPAKPQEAVKPLGAK